MNRVLDANAILRYLLNDIPAQADVVAGTIEVGASTIPEVMAEVVYVLSGVYKIDRLSIASTLKDFLEEISIQDKPVIKSALDLYARRKLDYVDCILIARAKLFGEDVLSFDKKLNSALKREG